MPNLDFSKCEQALLARPVDTARASLEMQGIPFKEVTAGVFKLETQYGATMYYSKHEKWIHRGKTRKGSLEAFSIWVRPLLSA